MKKSLKKFLAVGFSAATMLASAQIAFASSSVNYDFNSAGSVAADFNGFVSSGTVVQAADGGLSNSGSISVPSQNANAVFVTKPSYSLGPVGSVYNFSSFVRSVGGNGYSGMGFTATPQPSSANAHGWPFRPDDGLGVSFHGGGFVFSNGTDADLSGNWANDNTDFTTVKRSAIVDLLGAGSNDNWYKVVFKLTRTTQTTFDARIEVWISDASGTLQNPSEADAIFERSGIVNATLTSAPVIYSYINLSGNRVYNFDNYQVNLAGGSSVVAAGAPVVLTDSTTQIAGVATFQGTVRADGGAAVSDRGFVYDTAQDPIVTDNKVAVGNGVGTYTGTTSTLPNGTYYFRAYATNGTGTTYGSENTVVVADSTGGGSTQTTTPNTQAPSTQATVTPSTTPVAAVSNLARTGQTNAGLSWASVLMMLTGIGLVAVVSRYFKPIFGMDIQARYFDYFIKPYK